MTIRFTRRALVGGLTLGAGSLLTGCDRLGESEAFREGLLTRGEDWNMALQRGLQGRNALAREFDPSDISPVFRPNGTRDPATPDYSAHAASGFANWHLVIDGLVASPLRLSLAQLRGLQARTQITRHDCVEGWSAIGKWRGPRLGPLLDAVGLRKTAKFLVFHCADRLGRAQLPYYESIDLIDAFHPQTILALELNDKPLPIENGAPIRLRVERQLGYKQAKYVHRIEAVDRLGNLHGGKGGYWEDVAGYEWYAGI